MTKYLKKIVDWKEQYRYLRYMQKGVFFSYIFQLTMCFVWEYCTCFRSYKRSEPQVWHTFIVVVYFTLGRPLTVSMPQMGQLTLALASPLGVTTFLLMGLLSRGRLLLPLVSHRWDSWPWPWPVRWVWPPSCWWVCSAGAGSGPSKTQADGGVAESEPLRRCNSGSTCS